MREGLRLLGGRFNFRGAWAPATVYNAYDVVTYANSTYFTPATFTSGGTFNSANWVLLAGHGNTELGYAERVTDFTTASRGVYVDGTGLSITVTVADRPIMVRAFSGSTKHSAAGGLMFARIVEGATELVVGAHSSSAASESDTMLMERRLTPTPGPHTYKVQACDSTFGTAGTSTFGGSATSPSFIQAVEV